MRLLSYVSFLLLGAGSTSAKYDKPWTEDGYDTAFKGYSSAESGVLNVHLVSHSHDDVGWLKTVDQYYYGSNNSIQHAGVQYVLDTVVEELARKPDRKFMYVEQAFFVRWWNEQTNATKEIVHKLVKEKRFEFVNGGWCMHDEATPYYVDMIDQTTLGHDFLFKEFNLRPKIGWQIDDFGHSASQASLFQDTFEATFFARIDYQDYAIREKYRELEFVWRPGYGHSDMESPNVFTSVLQNHYSAPKGFQFSHDDPIVDGDSPENNLDEKIPAFIVECMHRAQKTKGNHLIIPMGGDFEYENARVWFSNMDKLIHYVNHHEPRLNLFYSTPQQYVDARYEEGLSWTVKRDDFFPYADHKHAYWTGFYTSRPALKLYTRTASSVLQLAKRLTVAVDMPVDGLRKLKEALAVVQHHDAVSGTEKQHVAYDYARLLAEGIDEVEYNIFRPALENLTQVSDLSTHFCWMSNASMCAFTDTHEKEFRMTILHGMGHSRSDFVSVPVNHHSWEVYDEYSGEKVDSQVLSASPPVGEEASPYQLRFRSELPMLGFRSFKAIALEASEPWTEEKDDVTSGSISNEHMQLNFDPQCGKITSLTWKTEAGLEDLSIELSHEMRFYRSSIASDQASGAYIFRPILDKSQSIADHSDEETLGCPTSFSVVRGEHVSELRQHFGTWAHQTYRLMSGTSFVEVEWQIDEVPIDDADGSNNIGKEVISRYSSNIASNGTFYTDSNGLAFQRRQRNQRPSWDYTVYEPTAGNYYPVNSAVYIKGGEAQLTIITDRTQGGSSLEDGSIELMVHRRTLVDDHRGVGEALNEPSDGTGMKTSTNGLTARGKHYILLERPESASLGVRHTMEAIYHTPLVAYHPPATSTDTEFKRTMFDGIAHELPQAISIVTFERLSSTKVLLRLRHRYAPEETPRDRPLSDKSALVFLDELFARHFHIVDVEEVSLTGSPKSTSGKLKKWTESGDFSNYKMDMFEWHMPPRAPQLIWQVRLEPLEIKTYHLTVLPSITTE